MRSDSYLAAQHVYCPYCMDHYGQAGPKAGSSLSIRLVMLM